MVSFSCEACNETMIKKKVPQHLGRCHAAVTCIDCSKTFPGTQFKDHNQCMTEDQKYQGKLYKPKATPVKTEAKLAPEPSNEAASIETKDAKKEKKNKKNQAEKSAEKRHVKVTKQTPLKKVLKKLEKNYKIDKKQLLNELIVSPEGYLSFVSS